MTEKENGNVKLGQDFITLSFWFGINSFYKSQFIVVGGHNFSPHALELQ